MHEFKMEYQMWRNVIAEKLLNGELKEEGFLMLDKKIQRIYDIGYAIGRYEGEQSVKNDV